MALALGLGSLFNHSECPNVSYTLDPTTDSIRYTATRLINPDEELCIFYGHNLWFVPVEFTCCRIDMGRRQDDLDGWGGLSMISREEETFSDRCAEEIVPEGNLPFSRIKFTPEEEEEEELNAIRTMRAWVVDIPDPRHITTMLKWLKQNGLENSGLGHLKRIRRQKDISTMLLSITPEPPDIPSELNLPRPYILAVPRTVALTMNSLNLKSSLWPTVFAPKRKGEPEQWSRGKVRWARDAIQVVVREACRVCVEGELPIVAYVPPSYEQKDKVFQPFIAHDTRNSTAHPLRHAAINLVRQFADFHATKPSVTAPLPAAETSLEDGTINGTNYLLTSLTLFTTHEPCLMCSMALLHSRIKEIFYLIPMEKTGGCGGLACLPKLEGVNHRFGILKWKEVVVGDEHLHLDPAIDA